MNVVLCVKEKSECWSLIMAVDLILLLAWIILLFLQINDSLVKNQEMQKESIRNVLARYFLHCALNDHNITL